MQQDAKTQSNLLRQLLPALCEKRRLIIKYILYAVLISLVSCSGQNVKEIGANDGKSFYVDLKARDSREHSRAILAMYYAAQRVCHDEGEARELDYEKVSTGVKDDGKLIEAYINYSCRNEIGYDLSKATPIFKMGPMYPKLALNKNISGYCTVQYDVGVKGNTENITIVECSPSGYFEEASLEAAKSFIYISAHEGGVPINTYGLTNRFDFSLK